MYKVGHAEKPQRSHKMRTVIILLILAGLGYAGYVVVKDMLKPETVLTQAKAVQTRVNYDKKTKVFTQPDFTIELPDTWQPLARPAGPYQSYTWSSTENQSVVQNIQIFEDTIPPNFGVNRALVVSGQGDHLNIESPVSDNCNTYTIKDAPTTQYGTPAKWHDVSFLCDTQNVQRDTIGTTSTDGMNIVKLTSPSTGITHTFLLTFTAHSLTPDYAIFTSALQSLKMQ